jgi:hypothetical protein
LTRLFIYDTFIEKRGLEFPENRKREKRMKRKYTFEVYESVCEMQAWENDEASRNLVDLMPTWEVLDLFLQWNGILGYSEKIIGIVNANK